MKVNPGYINIASIYLAQLVINITDKNGRSKYKVQPIIDCYPFMIC